MAYRSIDPPAKPMHAEAFWIQLIPQMTIDIVHYHEEKEKIKMKGVNRNGK